MAWTLRLGVSLFYQEVVIAGFGFIRQPLAAEELPAIADRRALFDRPRRVHRAGVGAARKNPVTADLGGSSAGDSRHSSRMSKGLATFRRSLCLGLRRLGRIDTTQIYTRIWTPQLQHAVALSDRSADARIG